VADSEKFLSNIAYTCEHLYPAPKLLIINYPHNPSTVTVEPEFYVEVVKLAKRYGFMVISDFAYADVAFDGYRRRASWRRPGRSTWASSSPR
jgi:alanine-synthesizing transaminase